jgi:hypothetical protein
MLIGMRYDTAVVAALDRLQSRTGQRFPIPEQITPTERTDLLLAMKLLDGEQIRVPATELAGPLEPEAIDAVLREFQQGPAELKVDGKYAISCGPHQLVVGRAILSASGVRLTNLDELRAAADTGTAVNARYHVPDDATAFIRLLPDDDSGPATSWLRPRHG